MEYLCSLSPMIFALVVVKSVALAIQYGLNIKSYTKKETEFKLNADEDNILLFTT